MSEVENRLIPEREARRVAETVYSLLQKNHGAQAKACRLGGFDRGYFAEAAERGNLSLRAFFAALETLDMEPEIYFRAYSGPGDAE